MFHRNILLGLFRSIDNSTYLQLSCIFHAITNLVIFSNHLSMKLINPQSFIALHLFEITPIFQYVRKQINNILIADTTTASIIRNGVE